MWKCLCDCGTECIVKGSHLKDGRQKSCGCLRSEITRDTKTKHGQAGTREYKSWSKAKARCYNVNDHKYPLYGARGITMCERWSSSFEYFFQDMGAAPEGHTIDRIDVNGNYEPENCKWSTPKEQARNRQNTRSFDWKGKLRPLAEISEMESVKYGSLYELLMYKDFPIGEAIARLPKG